MEFWLWFYVVVIAAGVALFRYWRANPKGIPPVEYSIATAIPLWSGFWYVVMAVGGGRIDVADQTTFWARYADWVVTTPLLLVALSLTAMHALPRKRWGLVRALVAADIIMITSGFLADLMESRAGRYGLYAVGVVALLVVFGLIWILGPSGFGLFGDTTDTALFVILPILSKVVWSAVDLALLRRLSDRGLLTVA
ncbi:bacteriorhodopsin [Micromonospora sp. NPDC000442]|uniref:bacteriorhodopsin n=1 Tax=Micromonospora sp. NPDC000442 TaxID=3364217 RepID=UPI003673C795